MNRYETLEAIRNALETDVNANTFSIGLEDTISAADYPIVRICPTSANVGPSVHRREIFVLVYFGVDIDASDGVEACWEALLTIEDEIISAMESIAQIAFSATWDGTDYASEPEVAGGFRLGCAKFQVIL
jgi:hypothetical protein